jgi:hypothetical protein
VHHLCSAAAAGSIAQGSLYCCICFTNKACITTRLSHQLLQQFNGVLCVPVCPVANLAQMQHPASLVLWCSGVISVVAHEFQKNDRLSMMVPCPARALWWGHRYHSSNQAIAALPSLGRSAIHAAGVERRLGTGLVILSRLNLLALQ